MVGMNNNLGAGPPDACVLRPAVPPGTPERTADLCVLSIGLLLSAAGAVVLIAAVLAADDTGRIVAAVGVYAAALPAMFLCALLFAISFETPRRGLFRRLDHAAIFLLIAATATPFAAAESGGGGAAIIWAGAAAGVFYKLRYPIGRAYRSAAVFLLSGWALLVALAPSVPSRGVLSLILLGGALYTIGLVFHLWRRLRFHRAIWHAFVIAGATAHYLAVAAIVL